MVQAVILDIDGVIVGEKEGYNFPEPHTDVLARLKAIREKGIPVILCSAKPHYSLQSIIEKANLNNPHITNAGAVIIDPIDNTIIAKHVIGKSLVKEILQLCLDNNVYVEFYTTNEYVIQKSQEGEVTQKHKPILQKDPKVVEDIQKEALSQEVIRIMPIAQNEEDKKRVNELLSVYQTKLSISWGVHPVAFPLQFGIITALGSSKKEGAQEVIKHLHVNFAEVLGVGDTIGDWNFIQLCGYASTLENGTPELKTLVKTKEEGKYFIGKSVDENGILDIFDRFSL